MTHVHKHTESVQHGAVVSLLTRLSGVGRKQGQPIMVCCYLSHTATALTARVGCRVLYGWRFLQQFKICRASVSFSASMSALPHQTFSNVRQCYMARATHTARSRQFNSLLYQIQQPCNKCIQSLAPKLTATCVASMAVFASLSLASSLRFVQLLRYRSNQNTQEIRNKRF